MLTSHRLGKSWAHLGALRGVLKHVLDLSLAAELVLVALLLRLGTRYEVVGVLGALIGQWLWVFVEVGLSVPLARDLRNL